MKCENCSHAEMCKWIDELEGRGCDFYGEESISHKVIEDIKEEIDKIAQGHNPMNAPFDGGYTLAIMDVFEIIDKHIGAEMESDK